MIDQEMNHDLIYYLFLLQPTSLLSKIFGTIVLLMIIYFLISIIHSMAQTFAKRRDEQEVLKLKKTN